MDQEQGAAPDSITILIREILIESGYPPEEAAKYTSHSMKTTFLSWCAKAGLAKGIRRILGGHSKPKENVVMLYSRDELTEPLRQLGHVLLWVKVGDLLPGEGRAGRWRNSQEPSSVRRSRILRRRSPRDSRRRHPKSSHRGGL